MINVAYVTGTGSGVSDLMTAINTLLTTTLGTDAWTTTYSKNATLNGNSKLTEAVWCGIGSGTDKIYIHIKIPNSGGTITNNSLMLLDGLAGYDSSLEDFEQPGSIQKYLKSDGTTTVAQPAFTIDGESLYTYWLFADTYRLIIVVRLSTYYESAYMGFITPISAERQFPYPMYIAGNSVATGNTWPNNLNGSFVFPSGGSGYLRRADGTWRQFDAYGNASTVPNPLSIGTLFPYNCGNTSMVYNYTSSAISDNNSLMIPIILCTTSPYDMCGLLDNIYYVSGTKDISAEQVLTFDSNSYILFDTKNYRGANTYFAVKLS